MKKSAIALAVAAALAASATVQAETTFYGRLGVAIAHTDPDSADDSWDVISSGSRWGVKGSEDLGNGLSAVYQLETNIVADAYNGNADGQTGRLAWVGLKGGFGTISLGTQNSAYYDGLGAADIFTEADWYSFYQGPFRVNNSVLYTTPGSISAFTGRAQVVMDGAAGEDSVDLYEISATGSFGPAFVGAGYRSNEVTDEDQWGISASADFAGAYIAAMYEHWDLPVTEGEEGDSYYLVAQYTIGNNVLQAGWGRLDGDNSGDRDEWALGVVHNLSSRTNVWVNYQQEEQANGDDDGFLTIGLRHSF